MYWGQAWPRIASAVPGCRLLNEHGVETMVAIVSGNSLGLNLTSLATLGQQGAHGTAMHGRNGQSVYVNAATGNLVLQQQDELLVARGHDAAALRTYNSQGLFKDDNGDNWSSGAFLQPLQLVGTLNTAGSTLLRTDRDGSVGTYVYDTARAAYVGTQGEGAHDTLTFIAADNQVEWRDGATGATQRYEAGGAWRLVASRDTSGNALAYAYSASGLLASVTTASGEVTWYDYSGNNLTQIRTVAAGGVTSTLVRYGYDASNRLASVTLDLSPEDNAVTDGRVYQTQYGYDGSSTRIASITQSDGSSLAFTYVAVGTTYRVETLRDALGQTTTFTYNLVAGAAGYTTVTDPLGLVTRYDMDAAGQLTKVTAPAVSGVAASRQFAYNAQGDVISVTDGEGRTVVFEYDSRGNQTLQRDAAGNTVSRSFDARNQLLTETVYLAPDLDGAGAAQPSQPLTTRYVYDAAGRNLLRFVISAEGRVTEHRYNGFGERITSVTYAAGAYPVAGLALTAAPGESELATWAAVQNLTATQRVDSTYDVRGQLQTRISFAKVAGTGEGIADGSQSVQRFVYDQRGRLLQTVSPGNGTTSHTYDGAGRVLSSTDALGQVSVTQYLDGARKTVVTLPGGHVTTSVYDAADRLVSVSRSDTLAAALGETLYFHDAGGRLRMTQDPTGVRHWWLYDAAGRKTAEIDGNGTLTEYGYNRNALVIATVRYASAVNTAALVTPSGTPALTVTLDSVRPQARNEDARSWFIYDAAGRLVKQAQSVDFATWEAITETRYDGASRVTSTIRYAAAADVVGSGSEVVVPTPAANAQDRVARSFHDGDGLLRGTLDGEGYLVAFNYDAAGRLVEKVAYATATAGALRATGTLSQLVPPASAADIRTVLFYDGKGQQVAEVDGEGYLTETVYDVDGNVAQTIRYATRVATAVTVTSSIAAIRPAASPNDRSTTRVHDVLGRLTQQTDPDGVVTRYVHDAQGRVTSTTRAFGTSEVRTLLVRHDVQGRLTGELSAEGAALLTGGQSQAQVDAIWAQHGQAHAYDAAGRRISTTDPLGNKTWFFYNADGARTHTINALGEVRETRYDTLGRVAEDITYAARIGTTGLTGGLASSAFTSTLATIANSTLDSRVQFTYTRDGQLASTTDALGQLTNYSYNVFGDLVGSSQAITTGQTLLHTHMVDRRGLRTGSLADTTGVNAFTSTVHDAFGRQVRTVDAMGNVRETAYDRLGRAVTTRDATNSLRSTSYDAFARVLTQTDPLGNATSYAYNQANRTVTVTTAEGVVTTTTFTRHGQVLSVADGKGQVTSYTYDRNGALTRTTTPHTTTSSSYDTAGRVIETVDGNGTKVAYTYDAANRVLTRRVDPAGLNLATAFQYDAKGQRVAVTDPNQTITAFEYDRKGQVLKQTVDPTGLGLQTLYSYDAAGHTLSVTSPAGTVTRYTYDALGRRTQEAIDPAGLNLRRSWSYDATGNVRSSTDAMGNVTRYAYDAEARLVFTLDPLGNLQQINYDAAGRITRTVSYATPVNTTGLGPAVAIGDIQPRVISQAAQDVVEHRVYDRDSRVTATVNGVGGVTTYQYDANGNVVARRAYASPINMTAWVPGTAPAPVVENVLDQRLTTVYDGLNRAVYSVDGIGAVVARTYDGAGNIVQQVGYAAPIAPETPMTKEGLAAAVAVIANPARDSSVRNTYDAAGRLAWTVDGTGAVRQNVYDKNGNVVHEVRYASAIAAGVSAASVVASAQDRTNSYAYDTANRMVVQVDALKAVTEFSYDRDGRVIRRTAFANPIATVPQLGTATTASAIRGAVTVSTAADRSTWYGYDAAGRQALVVDATGAATETAYDAAGHVSTVTAYAKTIATGAFGSQATLASLKPLVQADPADRVQRFAYDAAGRQVYAVDAAGAVKHTHFDGIGRVVRTTRYYKLIPAATLPTPGAISAALVPDASQDRVESRAYNAAGQVIATTDALNATETYRYDALGRKVAFVNKKGSEWTYGYDAAGRLITETSPAVSLTAVTTDTAGKLVPGAPADVRVTTRMAYDALGNLTQRTEAVNRPEQRVTRYEYDAAGRQVRVVHPTVGVYAPASDAVTSNGANGVASRIETSISPETQTFYDALGNAVASKDVGNAFSQKAYDLLGRVAYEIDALGFVTGYTRNAFGEVTTLSRHGSPTMLANTVITQASQAATKAQVEAVLPAPTSDATNIRRILTSYDRAGRVLEVVEPTAYYYDSSASAGNQAGTAGRKTRNTYDAFGQVVQVQALRNASLDTWISTTRYYDKAGRETASIDGMGYLTWREFDALGNVTESREYATARSPGSWTPAGYGAVAVPGGDDRVVRYEYDRLDRRTAETRMDVEYSVSTDGSSVRGHLRTSYGFDAVGNQTSVTDADGKTTYTYYDALGRVAAVAAPVRSSTASGAPLTPLTVFRRDAHGSVVATLEYANGASSATAASFTTGAVHDDDRVTTASYDALGRALQKTDANGASEFFSYDAHGNVAKNWKGVTGVDGITRTVYQVSVYDKLGQLVETRTPGSSSGFVSTRMEYDAFGSMTRRGVNAERQEYFDYDLAGNLWRTNSGDGVDRIQLFDLQGNVTADIRSSGSGRENYDVKGFANAQAANANPYTRRIDIKYDALGRVTEKAEAARQDLQGGVSVQRQLTAANVLRSMSVAEDSPLFNVGHNEVRLEWQSLAGLGSGDIKVYLEYRTSVFEFPAHYNDSDEWVPARYISGGTPRSYASAILNGDAAAMGATLTWRDSPISNDGGIGQVTRIVVYKKDVTGTWQVALDQAPGYGSNFIDVASPANLGTGLTLELRLAGSAGDTGWWTAGLTDFGDARRFDARGLGIGSYEYRVKVTPPGEAARVTGTGTVWLSQPPLNTIATPITFGAAGEGVLSWQSPGTSYQQVLRYRLNSSGAWGSLPVSVLSGGALSGVNTAGLAAGNYQFELLWTPPGSSSASHHATGTFTIVPPQPAYWVPPVNLPPIGGLSMGTTNVGGTYWYSGEDGPVYIGGSDVSALVWSAAGADVARVRVAGGAWSYLAIDNREQINIGFYAGVQKAAVNGLGPGTYELQILVGNPPTAQATGTLYIHAQSPGYYQTVYVQVPVSKPIIAYYEPVYETRYGTRLVSYEVRVDDPPYFLYETEDGPVWTYPYHYETRYYTESYPYQVHVGWTPVFATDEDGNILYQTTWETQARQQWVPATTPPPSVMVTTPPYTPGYMAPGTPTQYRVSVTTAPNSAAISTTDGSTMSRTPGMDGDSRWLRPAVLQKTDRWGNVIEITDPRAAYWKTTYKYNHLNLLQQQTQPDAGVGSAVTTLYYDKLGRQVAVRDANGNVNGQAFDAAGNLVEERHADTGVVTHRYDAFGQRVRTTDAEGKSVAFSYDKLGHMLRMVKGYAGVYTVDAGNRLAFVAHRAIEDSWSYDQLGRKLTQTNGNGDKLTYVYDLRGNVIETRQPMGQSTRAGYDDQGRKTWETDANGKTSTWTYDYFGQLRRRTDLGGYTYEYTYDNARQLVRETSTRGRNISYSYDAAGQLTTIRDWATDKTTTYVYDLSGRKLRERVVQAGATYQDNHLAYDAQGRLRDVMDARVRVAMAYDKVGNRTWVGTYMSYQGVGGEVGGSSNKHFKYDAMNRQVVVDAVDAAFNLSTTQGHVINYDKAGNRTSDTYLGNKAIATGGQPVISGYDEDGGAIYSSTPTGYAKGSGLVTEKYRYDALNRLWSVERDGVQIDTRHYDGADRVIQSGPSSPLHVQLTAVLNEGLAPGQTNGTETRINQYDKNGRLLHQKVLKSDHSAKMDLRWSQGMVFEGTTYTPDGYDAAGNSLGYVLENHEAGQVTKFSTSLLAYDGYREGTTTGVRTGSNGASTQHYDVNGHLVAFTDSTQGANNRTFVNDANGTALFVNQGGNVQRQMIVNGEVLGIYGAAVDATNPSSGGNPNFANLVDFDFGYSRISAQYPNASPGAYQVRSGDTLQSIARSSYGDGALWYRIAEANGLGSSKDLKVGQTLNIPNRVSTINNNDGTFKPYDPSKINGDFTPNMPVPASEKGGCGGFGKILMIIVAVVVTIYTAGAMAGAAGSVTAASGSAAAAAGVGTATVSTAGTFMTGAAALSGTTVAGASVGTAVGALSAAVGAAAGSIASQLVGMALGVQQKFDWRSVGLSALSAGVTSGVGSYFSGAGTAASSTPAVVGRAVASNFATQGIAVATGLQKRFNWRGVAASAVGAGTGSSIGPVLGQVVEPGSLAHRFAIGLVAGSAAALTRGGRIVVQQVATDAFGNALGSSLAASSGAPTTAAPVGTVDPLRDFIAKNNNWAHVNVSAASQQQRDALYGWSTGNDGLGFKPLDGISIPRMRHKNMVSDDLRTFSDSAEPNEMGPVGGKGDSQERVAFLGGLLSPANPAHPLNHLNSATGGTRGYTPVRPDGAGGPPPYDIVRERPSGAPGFVQANPSLGLGAPPLQGTHKPWFDRAIEGMPIGVKAAAGLVQIITTKVGEAVNTTPSSDSNGPGVRAYPDGSLRTPDGKFASNAGMPAPGTINASNYAEFLRKNGVDVVGTELEVDGPLGVRKYDIGTRNTDGTVFGIEIKSGGATKTWYQEITDMYVNRFGAAGRGRIEGQRVTGSMTIYLPPGGR